MSKEIEDKQLLPARRKHTPPMFALEDNLSPKDNPLPTPQSQLETVSQQITATTTNKPINPKAPAQPIVNSNLLEEFIKVQEKNTLQYNLESKEKYKQSLKKLLEAYKTNITSELSYLQSVSTTLNDPQQQKELISILNNVPLTLQTPELNLQQVQDKFDRDIKTLGIWIENLRNIKERTQEDENSLKNLKDIQSSINKIKNFTRYTANVESKLQQAEDAPQLETTYVQRLNTISTQIAKNNPEIRKINLPQLNPVKLGTSTTTTPESFNQHHLAKETTFKHLKKR